MLQRRHGQGHSAPRSRVGRTMRWDESRSTHYRTLAVRFGEEPEPRLVCPWCGRRAMGPKQRALLHPTTAASCVRCGRRVSTPMLTMLPAFAVVGISVALLARFCDAFSSTLADAVQAEYIATVVGLYCVSEVGAVLLIGRHTRLVRRSEGYGRSSVLRVTSDAFNCDSEERRIARLRTSGRRLWTNHITTKAGTRTVAMIHAGPGERTARRSQRRSSRGTAKHLHLGVRA